MKPRQPIKRTFWKRKPHKIKAVSAKRRKRAAKVSGLRRQLVNEAGRCMACGYSSRNPNPNLPLQMSKLCAHEISNAAMRDASLDKLFCLLILCYYCNGHEFTNKAKWSEARQLCLLMVRAPDRFDLEKYLKHTRPAAMQRITLQEIEAYLPTIPEFSPDSQ